MPSQNLTLLNTKINNRLWASIPGKGTIATGNAKLVDVATGAVVWTNTGPYTVAIDQPNNLKFFGHSLVYGEGSSDPTSKSMPKRVAAKLSQAIWNTANIQNAPPYGRSLRTTTELIAETMRPDSFGAAPVMTSGYAPGKRNFAVIYCLTNNLNQNFSLATSAADITKILKEFRAQSWEVLWVIDGAIDWIDTMTDAEFYATPQGVLRQWCLDNVIPLGASRILDLFPLPNIGRATTATKATYYKNGGSDRTHYSDAGYDLVADHVVTQLTAMIA